MRDLVERDLPAECSERETWRYVANQLAEAARGGDAKNVCSLSRCRACRSDGLGDPQKDWPQPRPDGWGQVGSRDG